MKQYALRSRYDAGGDLKVPDARDCPRACKLQRHRASGQRYPNGLADRRKLIMDIYANDNSC